MNSVAEVVMTKDLIVVFSTVSESVAAENIARSLLEKKLIACANISAGLKSLYWWENKICEDSEYLIIMKTRADLFEKVREAILELHPYKVPEIISISAHDCHEAFYSWVLNSTT